MLAVAASSRHNKPVCLVDLLDVLVTVLPSCVVVVAPLAFRVADAVFPGSASNASCTASAVPLDAPALPQTWTLLGIRRDGLRTSRRCV